MKKGALIFLGIFCLIVLVAPASAKAVSYVDFLNYGRRMFKINKTPEPVKKDEKTIDRSLPVESRAKFKEHFRLWKGAYEAEDISALFQYKDIFKLSEEEVNYFSEKEFNAATSSVVKNLKIDFTPGLIKVSGYSFMKMMKGDFYAEIKIIQGKDRIYPKVVKARYGKIPVPAMVVDNAIRKESRPLINFLYSNKNYENLEVVIDDNFLELKYTP
jgi:hypothetical protein